MLKLVFFVPQTHLEQVKHAIFKAGAGCLGSYDSCCWQTLGMGQFRALKGADPFIGAVGKLEEVAEWRVETICYPSDAPAIVAALRTAHPYEEVAFDLTQLLDPDAL